MQRAVREADSAALLVLPRILRRVIKQDRHLAGYLYRIPHRKSYVIDREPLLEIVDYEELGVSPEEGLPDKVILLSQPPPQKLEATPAGEALIRCWRLLFHARVHLAVQQCFVLGFLSPSQLRKRIHRIGETEFEEIRAVLQQEGFLLPPRNALENVNARRAKLFSAARRCRGVRGIRRGFFRAEVFCLEFLAAVLSRPARFGRRRRRAGTGRQCPGAFRGLASARRARSDRSNGLGRNRRLGRRSRQISRRRSPLASNAEPPSEVKFRKTLRRAQRPAVLGNVVRAAIWRAKALRYAPADMIARTKTAVRDDVNRLILRLHAALELDDPSPQPWHDTLRALVYSAADGFWTAEGRLLYDLQKVCVDHERDIYSTNLLSWLWSHVVLLFGWMRNNLPISGGRGSCRAEETRSLAQSARQEPRPPAPRSFARRSNVRCRISATCSCRSICAPPNGD